jgi:hypothetical protein
MSSSHLVLDQVDVAFDDERSVAGAGLLLPVTLVERLGIEQGADQLVDLGNRPVAARPGRKLLTLVHAMVAGGDCIDDVELLRYGSTQAVLGHRVMAASTWGRGYARSPSGTSASWTQSAVRSWAGSGRRVPGAGSDQLTGRKTVCQLAMVQASRTSSNCLKPSPSS